MFFETKIAFIENYHIHIYIWIGLIVVTILLELFSKKLVGLWFAVGSILGLLLALVRAYFTIQFISFLVVSIGFIIINEVYFKKCNSEEEK